MLGDAVYKLILKRNYTIQLLRPLDKYKIVFGVVGWDRGVLFPFFKDQISICSLLIANNRLLIPNLHNISMLFNRPRIRWSQ